MDGCTRRSMKEFTGVINQIELLFVSLDMENLLYFLGFLLIMRKFAILEARMEIGEVVGMKLRKMIRQVRNL